MASDEQSISSVEQGDDAVSCEENEYEMEQHKFLRHWTYCIRSDFASMSGVPATWEDGHPKQWGQEEAKIFLERRTGTTKLCCRPWGNRPHELFSRRFGFIWKPSFQL